MPRSGFVEHDRGIFDEHRIGKSRLWLERDDARAEFLKQRLVGAMLLFSLGEIDRLPGDKGQLTVDDAGTDGARNGGEHSRKVYMKMLSVLRWSSASAFA